MQIVISLSPTGSAGSAVASYTTDIIRGFIQSINVDYTSQAATTDLTVVEAGKPNRTLVSLTNINSDTLVYPSIQLTNNAGTGNATYNHIYIESALTISVAQADAVANSIVITILVSDN